MNIRFALFGLLVAACSGSSTSDVPSDAGSASLDATKPNPHPGQNGGDDDDVVGPGKDAGTDADAPDDAGMTDAGKDSGPPAPRYRVFVTKARFNADLKTAGGGADGLEGADKLCAAAATAANLGGTGLWAAWVSTTVKDANARVIDRSPWYLVDKTTVVFQTFDGLKSAPLHRIDVNETGSSFIEGSGPLTNRVWTGTSNSGILVATKSCSDWTDSTNAASGSAGTYVEASGAANWTRYALQPTQTCDKTGALYCFEQ